VVVGGGGAEREAQRERKWRGVRRSCADGGAEEEGGDRRAALTL
jgi:hypothetical protein